MRKKICLLLIIILIISSSLSAGLLYTKLTEPTSHVPLTATHVDKLGTSSCISLFGLITIGDLGIKAAMDNGNITKIHHVDRDETWYFLGLIYKGQLLVYGN